MSKVTPVIFWLDWKQRKLKKSNVVSLKAYKGLAEVAVKSLCELLVALPHFNFHNNIIVLIVPLMNDMSKSVGCFCCFCFSLTKNPRLCDYFFPSVSKFFWSSYLLLKWSPLNAVSSRKLFENKFVAAVLSSNWFYPPGNIRLVSAHIWFSRLWWWEKGIVAARSKVREASKHHIGRAPTTKNHLAQNVSTAEVEKHWFIVTFYFSDIWNVLWSSKETI